ncbi:MAG: peptide chain release factor N(5)-glutamine methyltransferase [Proteobacteria bacterium]|nr:peptide chain release factor N(5)-glutamine methyltransferase [Pseudomonadota bacterium]
MLIEEAKRISVSPRGGGNDSVILGSLIHRRLAHEPIAYITGHKEFWSLDFEVGPGVLIPRPETELLVEEALKAFPGKDAALNVLDLGTGSGAIPIAFLSERPNARGLGVEQSQDAMVWARKNIARHHARLQLQGDDWLMLGAGQFDIVFSNPPYIESAIVPTLDPDVKDYEPLAALDGGRDGLDAYRALAPIIAARLAPGGRAFLEIGQGQEQKVPKILAAAGLETIRVAPDLAGIPRCVIAAPAGFSGKKALETSR